MNLNDFGTLIKKKYADEDGISPYDSMDNTDLANLYIKKYPVYASRIDQTTLMQSMFPTLSINKDIGNKNIITDNVPGQYSGTDKEPTISPNDYWKTNDAAMENDLASLPGRAIATGIGYLKNALHGKFENVNDLKNSLAQQSATPYAPSQEPGRLSDLTDDRHALQNFGENFVRSPATPIMMGIGLATGGLGTLGSAAAAGFAGAAAQQNQNVANNKPTSLGEFGLEGLTNTLTGAGLGAVGKSISESADADFNKSLGIDPRSNMNDFEALRTQKNAQDAIDATNTSDFNSNVKKFLYNTDKIDQLKYQSSSIQDQLEDPEMAFKINRNQLINNQKDIESNRRDLEDENNEIAPDLGEKIIAKDQAISSSQPTILQLAKKYGITKSNSDADNYNSIYNQTYNAAKDVQNFIENNNNKITPYLTKNNITPTSIIQDWMHNKNIVQKITGVDPLQQGNYNAITNELLNQASTNGSPTLEKLINFKRDLQSEINYNSPISIKDQSYKSDIYNQLQQEFNDQIKDAIKNSNVNPVDNQSSLDALLLEKKYDDTNKKYSELATLKDQIVRTKAPGKAMMGVRPSDLNLAEPRTYLPAIGISPSARGSLGQFAQKALPISSKVVPITTQEGWKEFLNNVTQNNQ